MFALDMKQLRDVKRCFEKNYLGVISLVLPMMNTEIDRDK